MSRDVRTGNLVIRLSGIEQSLPYVLASRTARIVTREEILDTTSGHRFRHTRPAHPGHRANAAGRARPLQPTPARTDVSTRRRSASRSGRGHARFLADAHTAASSPHP